MARERMTSINLPDLFGSGLADYGRKSAAEMIAMIRAHAQHEKEKAEEILSASDEAFHVETYLGVRVRENREVLQPGTKPSKP